jgi:hypothetical protein
MSLDPGKHATLYINFAELNRERQRHYSSVVLIYELYFCFYQIIMDTKLTFVSKLIVYIGLLNFYFMSNISNRLIKRVIFQKYINNRKIFMKRYFNVVNLHPSVNIPNTYQNGLFVV